MIGIMKVKLSIIATLVWYSIFEPSREGAFARKDEYMLLREIVESYIYTI